MTPIQLDRLEKIKEILGTRWLLHPSNRAKRLTPVASIPPRPVNAPQQVQRLHPFTKTNEQLRAALRYG